MNSPVKSPLTFRLIAALALGLAPALHAANVATLTASDGSGTTSFSAAGHWSNGGAPVAGTNYDTTTLFMMRTLNNASSFTFAGDSLLLNGPGSTTAAGGRLDFTGTSSAGLITVPNLIVTNFGMLQGGGNGGVIFNLAGAITINSDATIITNGLVFLPNNNPIFVTASLSGSGTINLGSPSAGGNNAVTLAGSLSSFTGGIKSSSTALIPLVVSNATAQTLSGPISVANGFSKLGAGALTLSGSNTFVGGFTLSGAAVGSQLNINNTNALGAGSTFTISGGNNAIIDNTSGGPIVNLNNNPQAWNNDFAFAGSFSLNLGAGNVTLGGTRTVTANANTLTIGGVISGASAVGLTKAGAGILLLTATNTYSGNTTINGGTLSLGATGSLTNSTNIVVGSSGTFDVSAQSFVLGGNQTVGGSGAIKGSLTDTAGSQFFPGGSGTVGTLNFNNNLNFAGGDTLKFDFASGSHDLITVGGSLTPAGTTTINLASLPPGGLVNGDYVLIQVTNTLNGVVGNFAITGAPSPSRQAFSIVYNTSTSPQQVILRVTGTAASLVWSPSTSAWDIVTTTNWLNGAVDDFYFDGDSVNFTDLGAAISPVLNTTVTPASVVFNAASSYVLSGTGKITGGTGLTKTNSGVLTISTPANDYTGVTYIGGGTISVASLTNGGVASPIGAASSASTSLVLDGGALQYGGPTVAINRGATLNAGGGTLSVTNAATVLTLSGIITGTSGGGLTKNGNGTLALAGANSFNGPTTISGGTLQFTNASVLGTGNLTNNGVLWFSGNYTVSNSIAGTGSITNDATGTLTLSGTNSYSGVTTINGPALGGLVVASSSALGSTPLVNVISTTAGAVGGTRVTLNAGVSVPAGTALSLPTASTTVRSTLFAAGAATWNGPITINGDGQASPADQLAFASSVGPLTIGGNVTGVNFPGTLQLRGGAGVVNGTLALGAAATLQINDGVTWTINSTGNVWGLSQIAAGTLQLGANNALPSGTVVNLGAAGNGILDLAGFSQQVAGLVVAGGTDLITNSSLASDSTLIFATNGGAFTFGGLIVDGVHKTALTVNGGSLTLTAVDTYFGNTTISAGTLALSGAGSIANSPNISVGAGAVFDVSAETTAFVLGASQTLTGGGGTGTVVGNASLSSGSLVLNYASGTPTLLVTNGALTLNNNPVTVTVQGPALVGGTYRLIAKTTGGSVAGSVAGSALTVNGSGVSAGAQTSLAITGGELFLVVNHPPVASPLTVMRSAGISLKIALTDLATNWSDADGDAISLVSVSNSTNGVTVTTNAGFVLYPNAANVNDQFSYVIADAHGATATGMVNLLISTNNAAGQVTTINVTGSTASMTFAGIPGYTYQVQRSTDLSSWTTLLTTNAPSNGLFQFTDPSAPQPTAFYRLNWTP